MYYVILCTLHKVNFVNVTLLFSRANFNMFGDTKNLVINSNCPQCSTSDYAKQMQNAQRAA